MSSSFPPIGKIFDDDDLMMPADPEDRVPGKDEVKCYFEEIKGFIQRFQFYPDLRGKNRLVERLIQHYIWLHAKAMKATVPGRQVRLIAKTYLLDQLMKHRKEVPELTEHYYFPRLMSPEFEERTMDISTFMDNFGILDSSGKIGNN